MTEPTTTNIGLTVPNTGDLAGAWGTAALNPNFQIVDGMFGGVLNLSFSTGTTIVLTNNGASITPGAGPFQVYNSLIKVSGALSGNANIELPNPGCYRVFNNCTNTNSFSVVLFAFGGGGQFCACPPGELRSFFYDGTNVYFADMPPVGSFVKFGTANAPSWISLCSVAPYLPCTGGTYSVSTYPALGAYLGSAFGGDGVTTFGVPDYRGRTDVDLDAGTGRITSVMGGTIGASGGDQFLMAHSHGVTDPTHAHVLPQAALFVSGSGIPNTYAQGLGNQLSTISNTNFAATGISIQLSGAGGSQNIQPTIVSGITFIKT